jgi:hypothetical protein
MHESRKNIISFKNLVLAVRDQFREPWSEDNDIRDIYERLSLIYEPLNSNERELENLVPSRENPQAKWDAGAAKKKVLYLQPPERGRKLLPILTMEYDFARSIPEVRLKVALYALDEEGYLRVLGLRFEAPEGEGDHDYYHVQFSKGFERRESFKGDKFLKGEELAGSSFPAWIPEKEPTIPISARNSVELLLCVLESLYDDEKLSKFSTESEWFGQSIRSHLKNMNVVREGFNYWHLKVNKTNGREKFLRIRCKKDILLSYMENMNLKEDICNVEKIIESEFNNQSSNKQATVDITEENGELKISQS